MLKRVIACDFVPEGHDAGLLALRVIAGTSLLLKHGLEKVEHFGMMAAHFPNPLHIGAVPSLAFAMIGDFVCSILVVLGLGTRWAAAWSFVNIFVAWAFVHHFLFFGRGADHGELIVLYLAAMLTLVLAGPGKYSVDAALKRG
ncbi:MAG TPA: DoxX family protein [Acidobacteriaceae bacterium]|nr:DoxX family protein [Acidobacteriaceae bacterium]